MNTPPRLLNSAMSLSSMCAVSVGAGGDMSSSSFCLPSNSFSPIHCYSSLAELSLSSSSLDMTIPFITATASNFSNNIYSTNNYTGHSSGIIGSQNHQANSQHLASSNNNSLLASPIPSQSPRLLDSPSLMGHDLFMSPIRHSSNNHHSMSSHNHSLLLQTPTHSLSEAPLILTGSQPGETTNSGGNHDANHSPISSSGLLSISPSSSSNSSSNHRRRHVISTSVLTSSQQDFQPALLQQNQNQPPKAIRVSSSATSVVETNDFSAAKASSSASVLMSSVAQVNNFSTGNAHVASSSSFLASFLQQQKKAPLIIPSKPSKPPPKIAPAPTPRHRASQNAGSNQTQPKPKPPTKRGQKKKDGKTSQEGQGGQANAVQITGPSSFAPLLINASQPTAALQGLLIQVPGPVQQQTGPVLLTLGPQPAPAPLIIMAPNPTFETHQSFFQAAPMTTFGAPNFIVTSQPHTTATPATTTLATSSNNLDLQSYAKTGGTSNVKVGNKAQTLQQPSQRTFQVAPMTTFGAPNFIAAPIVSSTAINSSVISRHNNNVTTSTGLLNGRDSLVFTSSPGGNNDGSKVQQERTFHQTLLVPASNGNNKSSIPDAGGNKAQQQASSQPRTFFHHQPKSQKTMASKATTSSPSKIARTVTTSRNLADEDIPTKSINLENLNCARSLVVFPPTLPAFETSAKQNFSDVSMSRFSLLASPTGGSQTPIFMGGGSNSGPSSPNSNLLSLSPTLPADCNPLSLASIENPAGSMPGLTPAQLIAQMRLVDCTHLAPDTTISGIHVGQLVDAVRRCRERRTRFGIAQQEVANKLMPIYGENYRQDRICKLENLLIKLDVAKRMVGVLEEFYDAHEEELNRMDTGERAPDQEPAAKKPKPHPRMKPFSQHTQRHSFSEEARDLLRSVFATNPYPNRETMVEIADKLRVPYCVVRVWFANRRLEQNKRMKQTDSQQQTVSGSIVEPTSKTIGPPIAAKPPKVSKIRAKEMPSSSNMNTNEASNRMSVDQNPAKSLGTGAISSSSSNIATTNNTSNNEDSNSDLFFLDQSSSFFGT